MLSCTQHILRFAVAHPIDPRQFDPPVTEALRDPETLTLTLILELRKPRPSSPGLHGPKGVNGSHPAEAPPETLKNVGFKKIVMDQAQRASYLFRLSTAQTSGCAVLRFYTMDEDGLRPSRTGETPMVQAPYAVKRANPRFSFFADAEVTLRDGTRAVAQLAELSSRGCYIDTLEPIPVHTKLRLKISDGTSTCELPGKVIYMHSGGGLGIFGMGVLFGDMGAEQHSAIDAWLHRLAGQTGKNSGKHSFTQIRG